MNDLITKIQNAFGQQHANNGQTQNNINLINNILNSNQSFTQQLEQLKNWKDDPSLSIQNYTFWLFISIGICCVLLAIAIHPIFLLATILSIAFAFYKRTSTKALDQMIGYIQQRNLEEKYQLNFNYNDENQIIESPYNFPLFDLGDHENDIRNCIYGLWRVNDIEYPYMLFNYHYVDEVETKDSDGDSKTEYRHYDLWGIILENFPAQGISIASKQKRACRLGTKWSSGDIRFDDNYQLSGTNEMQLAKFFTPTHVLMLDQAMEYFKGDFYIQADRPSLCWLFNKDVTKAQMEFDRIDTVHDLVTQLETTTMPEYEQLRQSMFTILKEIQSQ